MANIVVQDRHRSTALIEVDLTGISEGIRAAFDDPTFYDTLGRALYDTWRMIAESQLHTSRDAYVESLREPVVEGKYVSVTLSDDGPNGRLAISVESGSDVFDMKNDILFFNGRHIVRFEHKGPGGKHGSPIGQGYRRHVGAEAASEIAKAIKPHLASLREGGGRFSRKRGRLPSGLAPTLPGHSTDLYAGMRHFSVQAKKTASGQYSGGRSGFETFRTMTPDSPGWWHPGIRARNFGEQAADAVDRMVTAAIDSVLSEVFR